MYKHVAALQEWNEMKEFNLNVHQTQALHKWRSSNNKTEVSNYLDLNDCDLFGLTDTKLGNAWENLQKEIKKKIVNFTLGLHILSTSQN